jgi:hypothetical protein
MKLYKGREMYKLNVFSFKLWTHYSWGMNLQLANPMTVRPQNQSVLNNEKEYRQK